MLVWLARIFLGLPVLLFHPTWVRGKKNMPKGKAVISSNHYSNWDIALYLLYTPWLPKTLAKKELFENKFVGGVLKGCGGIPIDRNSNDISAIRKCMKLLKDNKKLFVFPEGTRLKNPELILGEIKSGMAMIAIKTKSPIVPVWVEKKAKIFRRSVYNIGKPFELTEFYDKKLDEETLKQADLVVREKMLELREQSLNRKKRKSKSNI